MKGKLYAPSFGCLTIGKIIYEYYLRRDKKIFKPDTSDRACEIYGFKHGEKIYSPKGEATVIGVYDGRLWWQLENDGGRLSFWSDLGDLISSQQFRRLESFHKPARASFYNIALSFAIYHERSSETKNIFSLSLFGSRRFFPRKEKSFFSRLPRDIIYEIASYLSPHDIFKISLLCSEWYLYFRDQKIWKNLCIQYDIPYDEVILKEQYENNIVNYFFLCGLPCSISFMIIDLSDINLLVGKKYNLGGGTIGFEWKNNHLYLLNFNCSDVPRKHSYMNIKIRFFMIDNQMENEIFDQIFVDDPYFLFELVPLCFSITVLPNPYILSEIFL